MARRPSRRGKTRRIPPPERSNANFSLAVFIWFLAEYCELPDGHGQFVLEPHEIDALADYFAGIPVNIWMWPTGSRKSTLIGALALFIGTFVRQDPRIFILGGLGKHGRNALDAAIRFVNKDKRLAAWWEPQEYLHGRLKSRIPGDMGEILVVSAGRRTGERGGSPVEGEVPDAVFVEELHRHEDGGSSVATLITKGQKKSTGDWTVPIAIVTTAGGNWQHYLGDLVKRALKGFKSRITRGDQTNPYYIRAETRHGDLVLHQYAVPDEIEPPEPPGDDNEEEAERWDAEVEAYLEVVHKAQPVSWSTIRNLRISFMANLATPWVFQRQHCNQWVVQTQAALSRVGWARGLRKNLKIPKGAKGVVVGLDSSAKWDATALVPVWINPDTKKTWTSGAQILTPNGKTSSVRKKKVFKILKEMAELWPDLIVAFDENYGGGLIAEQVEEDLGLTTVNVGTGKPFELGSMLLAELISDVDLEHDDNPEMTEHIVRTAARHRTGGNGDIWRVDKPPGGERIDGTAGLVNGVWIAHNPPPVKHHVAPNVDVWGPDSNT